MLDIFNETIKPVADELDELIGYIDGDNCTHENISWTEEAITDHAQYVGYRCDFCNKWVEKDEEELYGN